MEWRDKKLKSTGPMLGCDVRESKEPSATSNSLSLRRVGGFNLSEYVALETRTGLSNLSVEREAETERGRCTHRTKESHEIPELCYTAPSMNEAGSGRSRNWPL